MGVYVYGTQLVDFESDYIYRKLTVVQRSGAVFTE